MLLTALIGKRLAVEQTPRGFCVGIGINKKSGRIKYLLCANEENGQTHFAVPYSLLIAVHADVLQLSKIRAVLPTQCVSIYLSLPVYTAQGASLGALQDGEIVHGALEWLYVDGERLPYTRVTAVGDAILLQSPLRFPLGQSIPAPYVEVYKLSTSTITKNVLKNAIQSQSLIRLTLSLAPFNVL